MSSSNMTRILIPEDDKDIKPFPSNLSPTRYPVNGPQRPEHSDRPDGSEVDCSSRELPVVKESEESGYRISDGSICHTQSTQ